MQPNKPAQVLEQTTLECSTSVIECIKQGFKFFKQIYFSYGLLMVAAIMKRWKCDKKYFLLFLVWEWVNIDFCYAWQLVTVMYYSLVQFKGAIYDGCHSGNINDEFEAPYQIEIGVKYVSKLLIIYMGSMLYITFIWLRIGRWISP